MPEANPTLGAVVLIWAAGVDAFPPPPPPPQAVRIAVEMRMAVRLFKIKSFRQVIFYP